jgi:hypothetical protein
MDNSKISALTSATTPLAGTETLPIVQSSTTKQVSVANLTVGRDVTTAALTSTISSSGGYNSFQINNTNSGGYARILLNLGTSGAAGIGTIGYAPGIFFKIGTDTDASSTPITFILNGSEKMRLASTGIVTMQAYGAGAATFSAAGVISSVSDETWKIKDGVPVDTDAMIKKLQPGYWYYNNEKKEIFGKDRQLGFYAQNVNAAIGAEAAPQPQSGKPWGYYDRSILAVVVISLQKALDTIDSLTMRLTAMEEKATQIPA